MAKAILRTPDILSLRSILLNSFGYEPHEEQLQAIKTLAVDHKDLILIARTGFGKSMVFQSIPLLRSGICLIIMPLNLLEDEQVRKVFKFWSLKNN
jgi:superfamily II DNA helicase RecQ